MGGGQLSSPAGVPPQDMLQNHLGPGVSPPYIPHRPSLDPEGFGALTSVTNGVCVGCHRFSPDILGLQASSALAWLTLEVLAILLSLYLVTANTDLTTIDLVAFLGYKYVG